MPPQANPRVFLDVSIDNKQAGRIVLELFAASCPRTAENFRALCTGEKGEGLSLAGSPFHRIIPKFMAQGGDFTLGNGKGGRSIYGADFPDENFAHKHAKRGDLSMANAGKNTNGSQFFLTFAPCPALNGKHVVFGQVVQGLEVLDRLEELGTTKGAPKKTAKVFRCGELPPAEAETAA